MYDTTDQPWTGECSTCGATHTFDTEADAATWEETHAEIGHYPAIEAA